MSAGAAWAVLSRDAEAVLVDVRTEAEWRAVGVPDGAGLKRTPVLLPWQRVPGGPVDPDFVGALRRAGVGEDDRVVFLCRSGVRSLHAALAAEGAGYARTVNVVDGFEGPPDARGQRGTVAGWQAEGLPVRGWPEG